VISLTLAQERMLAAVAQHPRGGTASTLGEWLYCRTPARKPQNYARPAARVLVGLMHLGLVSRARGNRRAATWMITYRGQQARREAKVLP